MSRLTLPQPNSTLNPSDLVNALSPSLDANPYVPYPQPSPLTLSYPPTSPFLSLTTSHHLSPFPQQCRWSFSYRHIECRMYPHLRPLDHMYAPPPPPSPPHTHTHPHTQHSPPHTHRSILTLPPPPSPLNINKTPLFQYSVPPPPSILTNHRPLLPSIITINHTLNTHKTPSLSLLTTHHNTHTHTHTRTHLTVRGGPAYYFTNTDTGDHPEVTLRLPLTQLASTGTCATRYTPPPSSCSPVPSQTRHSGSWVTIDRHSHDTTLGTPPLPHNIPSPYHDTPSTTT